MHLFPVTVIDDFFPNVQEVLDLAKSQEYERFGEANYPGVTSKDYINNFNLYIGESSFIRKLCK